MSVGKDGPMLFADDGFLARDKFWLQEDPAYLILVKEYKEALVHRRRWNLEGKKLRLMIRTNHKVSSNNACS